MKLLIVIGYFSLFIECLIEEDDEFVLLQQLACFIIVVFAIFYIMDVAVLH